VKEKHMLSWATCKNLMEHNSILLWGYMRADVPAYIGANVAVSSYTSTVPVRPL
jgi:hypothetical protein